MSRLPLIVPFAISCAVAGMAPASAAPPALAPVDASQHKLMLVLDSSGSMADKDASGRPKIDAARSALHQVVTGLPTHAQAGMRVFGATVAGKQSANACTDSQLAVPLGADNTAALSTAVDAYQPFGETPMAYAMQQAASDLGNDGQRSMILVSDGADTCSPDPCTVAQQIAARGIDMKIDVVGFRVSGKAQRDLQCIAHVGRGSYFDASNTQDLTASLQTLSARAVRPFAVTGTPVAGTPIIDGAPTVTAGQWSSRIGPSKDERYYQVTHTPGDDAACLGRRPGRLRRQRSLHCRRGASVRWWQLLRERLLLGQLLAAHPDAGRSRGASRRQQQAVRRLAAPHHQGQHRQRR